MSYSSAVSSSICFLMTSMSFAGAEVQVVSLASELRRRGWGVRVVSMLPDEAKSMVDRLEHQGIEFVSLDMRRGIPNPRAVLKLAALLRKWRPQVLHCHMVHANFLGRLVRLLVSIPVVVSTAHSINEGGRLRELFYRLTDPLTDITTNISQAAVDRYIKIGAVPRRRIRFIPNGLNLDTFRTNPRVRQELRRELQLAGRFVWLAVGRFDEAKDYPTMLRAFTKMEGERSVVLLLAGGDGLEDKMTPLVRQLGLEHSVRFLGLRDDIQAVMNGADGYLMSSAWEGLPMVLLEAAATSLPIVTTDVGGNREAVQDEVSGFVVEPGNPDKLAQAMRRMMELPDVKRNMMGEEGRRLVERRFGLRSVVDQWESLYVEFGQKKGCRVQKKP